VRTVIIAFADQNVAGKIRTLLISKDLPVCGVCGTGSKVLQIAAECDDGGIVICPLNFPDMPAREVMSLLPDSFDMLVMMTPRQQGMIGGSGIFQLALPSSGAAILEYVRQLLETRQLRAAFTGMADSSHDPGSLPAGPGQPAAAPSGNERNAEERKTIEQAKYLLMNRRQMSEAEAHRYLQKKSMETGIRMAELASRIIKPV
jgi:two-component system, response regulator PdtaR